MITISAMVSVCRFSVPDLLAVSDSRIVGMPNLVRLPSRAPPVTRGRCDKISEAFLFPVRPTEAGTGGCGTRKRNDDAIDS